MAFDPSKIQQAREAGYSDDEILESFVNKNPTYKEKILKARKNGYEPSSILESLGKAPKEKPSRFKQEAQSLISAPAGQAALGAAKRATWPLDVLSMLVTGEALSGLEELKEKNLISEEDEQKYLQAVSQIAQYLPNQGNIERVIGEKTGLDFEPKDKASKLFRKGAEFAAFSPGSLLPKIGGGIAGVATSEGAQALGLPEPLADILGQGASIGTAATRKLPVALNKEAQEIADIGAKHGLRQFEGLQRESVAGTPTALKSTAEQASKELGETATSAINKIIDSAEPLNELRKRGYTLADGYKFGIENATDILKQKDLSLSTEPIQKFLRNKHREITRKAPSLGKPAKDVLKEIKEISKDLNKAIEISPEKIPEQLRQWNSTVKQLYKRPEFRGSESELAQFYGELKDVYLKEIGALDPEAKTAVEFANRMYAADKRLARFDQFLEPVLKDGFSYKKLDKLLTSPKGKFLARDFGADMVKELKEIAKYGEAVENQVFKRMKIRPDDYEKLSQLFGNAAHLIVPAIKGVKAATLPFRAVEAVNRMRGNLMLSPKTRKEYKGFLKALKDNKVEQAKAFAGRLDQLVEEEWGSWVNLTNDDDESNPE